MRPELSTVNFRDGCQLGLSARAVLTTEPFSEAAHQRAVGERRTVGAERNHGGAVATLTASEVEMKSEDEQMTGQA